MVKITIGVILVGLIGFILYESWKKARAEEVRAELEERLINAKNELANLDIKEDIVETKVQVAAREKEIAGLEAELAAGTAVPKAKVNPDPEPGATLGKKKVAKKKVAKKKVAKKAKTK